MKWTRAAGLGAAALGAVAVRDLTQKEHALKRNYPVVANARYWLERIGPELRQYIVTSNDEERPFSRDQRAWVYQSAKRLDNYVGFGTDNDVEHLDGYPIIKHTTFIGRGAATGRHAGEGVPIPAAKVLGGPRGRAKAFRPASVINISAMSFGSLSAPAVTALNKGAQLAGCLHNTGEGGMSSYHLQGGDLIYQIGTAYFGCRDEQGRFSLDRLVERIEGSPVKAIEIKLSQGAKPGLGGMLPGAKVTGEISEIRGIPEGVDCASPSRHSAFHDTDSMLDVVEQIADATGLPVGIKSAVGNLQFWDLLVEHMADRQRGVDFVTIDGGEGGTGAAPQVFSDAVAYPFRIGFSQVHRRFVEAGLADDVVFIGSGKLGIPENAVVGFALGCDLINVGREAMLSIGCIQAQKCHTDHCPTGVATQNKWFMRGLDPEDKSVRCANYIVSLRRDLLKLSEAVGVDHPGLITPDDVDIVVAQKGIRPLADVYGYDGAAACGVLGPELAEEIAEIMRRQADEAEQKAREASPSH
ncbi:FMN-binding glutamate synthase family protein [Nocardioides rotundus]|uniref:FMN-binding glutamate synthase family protein n=1 Tax=Nocardioides rotundus TaxID=1774216 RepID=UPI001CBB7448|nr:FMN-binding glutamate synthase family protein [Nocardioides rotundus]UAL30775.1 FMN-binding glutamate synthase family protein [Nocardioides rotundus]